MENIKKELRIWFDKDTNTYSLKFGEVMLECLSEREVERLTIGELIKLEKEINEI